MSTKTWTQSETLRRSGPVWVVCRANSDHGPWMVFRDGYLHRESDERGTWECQCGGKAATAGHYLTSREAQRVARERNREEEDGRA